MAIAVTELHDGIRVRTADNYSTVAEVRYKITGVSESEDEHDILAALRDQTPTSFDVYGDASVICFRSGIHLDEEHLHDLWKATILYAQAAPATGSISFDTTGGVHHITQSRKTVSQTSASDGSSDDSAPDFNGAIGVTEDGEVQGVDIVVPSLTWTETYPIEPALITNNYVKMLADLTGTVNNATFKTHPRGSVRFDGAVGNRRGTGLWEVSFKFTASANATDIPVGDITVPAKAGWEYMWVLYEAVEDEASKTLVRKPRAAYVEEVYPYSNFSTLGLP